jgi:hypothetical protein
MPQYNGVWTIEAAAQAQSNQQWVTDPNFRNTTLLLQADNAANGAQNNTFLDSSSNSFAVTRTGTVTQGSFSPFSPGWSNFFDGTVNSALYFNGQTAFAFGTGEFTIEGWFFMTVGSTAKIIFDFRPASTNGAYPQLSVSSTNTLDYFTNSSTVITGGSVVANSWNHFALSRVSGSTRLFLNGVQVGSTYTDSTNYTVGSIRPIFGDNGFTDANYWSGYMSNIRIIKGQGLFNGAFTPSTSPLTTTAVGATGSGAASSITGTVSLLFMQSNRNLDVANGYTINTNGTKTNSVQAFAPFAPQFQWTEPVIGGSGYFAASGDYLTIPANAAFAPGTSDYTVDGWIYSGSNTLQTIWAQTVGGTNYFVVEANYPTSVVQITSAASGGGTAITSAATLRLNAWNHFTVSRTSGVITVWCNGSAGTPTANTVNLTNVSYVPTIGTYSHSTTTNVLIGYLANLRYIKGTALSGATIPTAPNTAVTNTQALLNYTNAGIYDGKMANNLQTVGNAQVSTSVVKYGSGSMAFDGTGDYLFISQTNNPLNLNWELYVGDFTIELWFYANTVASTRQGLIAKFNGNATTRVDIEYAINLSTSSLVCTPYQSTTNFDITFTGISAGTWNHVAMVRSGNQVYAFLNGVRNATTQTVSGALNSGTTWPLQIGRYTEGSVNYDFNGYIDDLRITKGIARYTANFIPPLVALPRQ